MKVRKHDFINCLIIHRIQSNDKPIKILYPMEIAWFIVDLCNHDFEHAERLAADINAHGISVPASIGTSFTKLFGKS